MGSGAGDDGMVGDSNSEPGGPERGFSASPERVGFCMLS